MVSGHTEVVTQTRRTPGAAPGRPARGRPGHAPARARARRGPPAPRPAARSPRAPSATPAGCHGPGSATPGRRHGGVARSSRTPFVFLVVGLLGGGLLCLLLINTILDTGSYQITQLQQENVTLVQQTQELQARVAQEESPAVLAGKASQLGMQEPGLLRFLDLRKGKIEREPTHAPGVSVYPPGYTP